MIDVCVNLMSERFDEDRAAVVERAFNAGCTHLVLTGSCLSSSAALIDWSSEQCSRTVGIHPHTASEFSSLAELRDLAVASSRGQMVAIGECGLDYNRMFSTVTEQRHCFEAHIALASELNKPLFLHQRDAIDDFIAILDDNPVSVDKVVHCFTDGPVEAEALINRGCWFGITGWVCDTRRNSALLEALPLIPRDRLMIETDAPWLTPRGLPRSLVGRHRRNEPAFLRSVAEALSQHLEWPIDELLSTTTQNTHRFFGLNSCSSPQ